jgi:hypothetical protein
MLDGRKLNRSSEEYFLNIIKLSNTLKVYIPKTSSRGGSRI